MKVITNILISVLSFAISYGIAHLTGSVIVKNAVLLAYVIHWIAYIPAYVFQTEKFYDLTGSVTYLSVVWFVFLSTYQSISLNFGNLILVLLISIWTIRLGLFLFMRIHKAGEDKRFRTIKTSASQFFMTFTISGLWVTLCSMCALVAISSPEGLVMNALTYVGIILFIIGFGIEIVADNQKTAFRSIEANKDSFITSGLWSKSRHPNYFGEVLLWFAIAVISFSSLEGLQLITLISPVFTYILLVYVSGVRMLEDMNDKKWADNEQYKSYKKNTPMLFPKL
ncbi:MAG: wu:fc47e12 [SAR86 cluster bacterium SAR86A]|jgi:steroid 5-alpha reductase family enzyme|uniref:Wu:fc47e12 n=1 Tax=SAR86 cluster bacterium SAR86A TaxID=1123866 RepID=J4UXS8_9GAMM|nr:MAG: wu:fc47e12 [SAR86 cluster bacterium SAR86A]